MTLEEQFKPWPTLKDYTRDYILDRIRDFEGQFIYVSDLGFNITETDNCNGALFCTTKESLDFIANYRHECGDIYEKWYKETGTYEPNPLLKPDAFCVLVIIESVNNLLNELPTIQNLYQNLYRSDSRVELSKKIIDHIVMDLNGEKYEDEEVAQ